MTIKEIEWPIPYYIEVRLFEQNAKLRAALAAMRQATPHILFDYTPELPNMLVDAIESGLGKLRTDRDATEFHVAVKLVGELVKDEGLRLDIESGVKCTVKAELYDYKDKATAPLDVATGRVISVQDAFFQTPFGAYAREAA